MKKLILDESISNVGEIEDKIHPEVPASFAAAVEDSRELERKAEKVFKDKEKEAKDSGLGNTEKDREGYKIKYNPGAKKLHLEESLFEPIEESWHKPQTYEGDIYLVPKKRKPLADLLQSYLTSGEFEWGYVKHPNGVVNPTPLKGAQYNPKKVGVYYDDEDNSYIKVSVSKEENLQPVKDIATKFHKEYEVIDNSNKPGIDPGYKFQLIIKLEDKDWDEPYYDPNENIYQGSKKEEALNEASEIKVKVYNFRPSTEQGRETYRLIADVGKLGNLQDMLEEMQPDNEEIDADEMNRLLSEDSQWVLNMLDIHEDENL